MSHKHMDGIAAVYEETIPKHVRDHYLRKRVGMIQRCVARGRLLDIGCGTGLLAEALRQTGLDVMGMDESMNMLQECQRKHAIVCFCGDSTNIPLVSHSMDAVICVATLHHIGQAEHVRSTIAEMLRVVRPNGALILWDHNPCNPYWPFFMKRLPQDQEPTRLIPLRELAADLTALGVRQIAARRLGLVPDFAPPSWLWLFQAIEWCVERVPGLRCFCAHNVVTAIKPASSTFTDNSTSSPSPRSFSRCCS